MDTRLYTIRAMSPLHCGVGQGLNDIDLPTIRNSVTGHPIVPASSIKGVLKEEYASGAQGKLADEGRRKEYVDTLFGSEHAQASDFASAISISDANLLALPVRSFHGTFAYLTSNRCLQQLKNNYERVGRAAQLPALPSPSLANEQNAYQALLTTNSILRPGNNQMILLEDLDLIVSQDHALADKWAQVIAKLVFTDQEGQSLFGQRFVITDDNVLNFLCETALPVDAHIAIDDQTGTVKKGALWYEETVPPETLFSGVIAIGRSCNPAVDLSAADMAKFLTGQGRIYCQIGGKATTGKGFVSINYDDQGGSQ